MRFFDEKAINLLTNYGGGYSYRDIVQEVFMKRTIITVLSIILIAFAFTACRPTVIGVPVNPAPSNPSNPSQDASVDSADSYGSLFDALTDPDVKTINLANDLSLTPEQASALKFDKTGLVFDGKGKTITIGPSTSGVASLSASTRNTDPATSHVFEIDSDNITFRNINIEVLDPSMRTWVINVNKNGFTFDGGSITGIINDAVTYSTVDMGIVIASGTAGTTIKDVTFKGNFTPVHSTSPDFTIDGAVFESGMIFDNVDPAKTVVKNCRQLDLDGEEWNAAIDLYTTNGPYSSTSPENAFAVRNAILSGNNNTDVTVTIDGKSVGTLSVWDSNAPGNWYAETGNTDTNSMKLSLSFDAGTMTAKVDDEVIYSYKLDGITESKIGRIILQSENDGEEYSVNWTLPVVTADSTSITVPETADSWTTDRTDPKSFEISGNTITVTTTDANLGDDNFYRYQGKAVNLTMDASSSWEVSTTLSFDNDLYATGFSPSIWLDVENSEGADVDWAIIKLESSFAE